MACAAQPELTSWLAEVPHSADTLSAWHSALEEHAHRQDGHKSIILTAGGTALLHSLRVLGLSTACTTSEECHGERQLPSVICMLLHGQLTRLYGQAACNA